MICLEINAEILLSKLQEFNQSKLSFINSLQKFTGYIGFTEKPGQNFHIQINWKNRESLDEFINTEQYRVFHGAIITLSKTNSNKIYTI